MKDIRRAIEGIVVHPSNLRGLGIDQFAASSYPQVFASSNKDRNRLGTGSRDPRFSRLQFQVSPALLSMRVGSVCRLSRVPAPATLPLASSLLRNIDVGTSWLVTRLCCVLNCAKGVWRGGYEPAVKPRRMAKRSPPGACMRPAALVLRIGSAHYRPLPQVLEAQQHGQHPFELSVEMNLVAAEPL